MSFKPAESLAPPQLANAQERVNGWRAKAPSLTANDAAEPSRLPKLLRDEVDELEVERHSLEGSLLAYLYKQAIEFQKELGDVFVFLFSLATKHDIELDFLAAWNRANGQGARSPIFDQLIEKALNIEHGDVVKNAQDFLAHVISLSHYLPIYIDLEQAMGWVIEKNEANYPNQYFSGKLHGKGRDLSLEEMIAQYTHSRAMLKILRAHYGSPLEPWMHEPFSRMIHDYGASDVHVAELPNAIARYDERLKAEAALLADTKQLPTISKRKLEYMTGLLAVGSEGETSVTPNFKGENETPSSRSVILLPNQWTQVKPPVAAAAAD